MDAAEGARFSRCPSVGACVRADTFTDRFTVDFKLASDADADRERSIVMNVSVCVYVCVCLKALSYLRNCISDLHQSFYACYLWPWLCLPLAA